MTDEDPSKVLKPRIGAFYRPSTFVRLQLSPVLSRWLLSSFAVRANQLNSSRLQSFSQRIRICRTIIDQSVRQSCEHSMRQHRFNQADFGRTGTIDRSSQGSSVAVNHGHHLCPFAALGFSYAIAPFFALVNIPSARAVFQSSSPSPSNSRKQRCQAFWKTPDLDHICNLRQQVGYDGNDFGKSFHRAPDRSTHKIPSRQGLGGTHGRPPARVGAVHGNKSSITDHCSSVSSVFGSILDAVPYRRVDGHHTNVNCMIRVSFQPDINATPLPLRTLSPMF
jgi:hypothetical protein